MHDKLPTPLSRATRALPRWTQLVILGAVAAVAALAFVVVPLIRGLWEARQEPATSAAAAPPGVFRPTPAQWTGLKVASVVRMTFRAEQSADGKIANNDDRTTPVFSPYSGRVVRLIAKPGDRVEQGAPLIAVEATEFVQGQNDLISAAAALNKAEAQLKLAQINEKRQHELYLAKAGALKDWEQAQTDLASAWSDRRSAEIALAAVKNRLRILGKSDDDIRRLESAAKMSAEAVVTAPIAGTVIQRKVGLGQYITAGASDPIFLIGDLSTVWLVANVRETDAPLMRVGQPVEVRVLAYPGRVFKAKLTYVAPSVDPNTHRLPVRAEVENPDDALKPEMFARFSIITGDGVAAAAVPEGAIVYEGDTARVWVARDDGTIVSRQIRTGRSSDGMVEVLSGLAPGEKVIAGGTLFIDRAASGG